MNHKGGKPDNLLLLFQYFYIFFNIWQFKDVKGLLFSRCVRRVLAKCDKHKRHDRQQQWASARWWTRIILPLDSQRQPVVLFLASTGDVICPDLISRDQSYNLDCLLFNKTWTSKRCLSAALAVDLSDRELILTWSFFSPFLPSLRRIAGILSHSIIELISRIVSDSKLIEHRAHRFVIHRGRHLKRFAVAGLEYPSFIFAVFVKVGSELGFRYNGGFHLVFS